VSYGMALVGCMCRNWLFFAVSTQGLSENRIFGADLVTARSRFE